jgi:polyisoprenoid-binding protein YceI
MIRSKLAVVLPALLLLSPPAVVRPATAASAVEVQPAAPLQHSSQALRLVVAPHGNNVRYLVREQLAGFDLPNDAVGTTARIEGGVSIGADGKLIPGESRFVVDMASLETDNSRRDNYVRRNTLVTEQFPTATFVARSTVGLPAVLPERGDLTFELIGDLTIKGVTQPATWQVTGRRTPDGGVSGLAKTSFNFAKHEIAIPRVRSVLSVDDQIRLEYNFHLVPPSVLPPR